MSPEKKDFSSFEYTGKLLSERQAKIYGRMLLGQGSEKIAEDFRLSLDTVIDARRRIKGKIERETGAWPKDNHELLSAMMKLGEVSYRF